MTEQARQAQREYLRRWRAENKDRIRAANERYWERKAMEAAAADGEPERGENDLQAK